VKDCQNRLRVQSERTSTTAKDGKEAGNGHSQPSRGSSMSSRAPTA